MIINLTVTDEKKEIFSIGEDKQFLEIYNANLRKVVFFANSYIKDIEEAQNIAHDVFISFWKNKNNLESNSNISSYLITSAKNRCLNLLKKNENGKKYVLHKLQSKTDYLNSIALSNMDSTRLLEAEVETLFFRGLTQMKPKVRRTFILSRMKGLKNKEIAEVEGVAESTIEARISSALLLLRKVLKDYI